MNRTLKAVIASAALSLLVGCGATASSGPSVSALSQSGPAAQRAVKQASASGSACGIELLDFLPFGTWTRTERAYHSAVSSVGAKALLKPTVSDSRIDLMVATVKCSSVSGTAIY